MTGVDISSCPNAPAGGWPVGITLSNKQGKSLKDAAAAGPLNVTLKLAEIPAQKEIGLAAFSGNPEVCIHWFVDLTHAQPVVQAASTTVTGHFTQLPLVPSIKQRCGSRN